MRTDTVEQTSPTQTHRTLSIKELIMRVQAEYREMPELKLTETQARRLWSLDQPTCSTVLRLLVDRRFLKRTAFRYLHSCALTSDVT